MNILAMVFGLLGTVAVMGFFAFAVWVDYRKKRADREAAHQERMKALELGHALPDAEIARAHAYASAVWAAALIGVVVPLVLAGVAAALTIVAVVHREPFDRLEQPMAIGWSIAGFIILITVWRSLSVIRQLSRPVPELPPRLPLRDGRPGPVAEFQQKRAEL